MTISDTIYQLITGQTIFKALSGIVFPKAVNNGIKVDSVNPTFGWEDLKGVRIVDVTGTNAPVITAYKTGSLELGYNASDIQTWEFHLGHMEVLGGNKYIHAHVKHNGTSITGNLVLTCTICHNYGNNRTGSPAPLVKTITIASASLPQYETNITDLLFAQEGGGSGLLDSSLMYPDDEIVITMTVTTLPTISGGTSNRIFISHCDIHREITGIGTKTKNYPFYS